MTNTNCKHVLQLTLEDFINRDKTKIKDILMSDLIFVEDIKIKDRYFGSNVYTDPRVKEMWLKRMQWKRC